MKSISRTIKVTTIEADAVFKTEKGYESRKLEAIKTGEKIDEFNTGKLFQSQVKQGETLVINSIKEEEKTFEVPVNEFIMIAEKLENDKKIKEEIEQAVKEQEVEKENSESK
jgi:hypothetical protein